MQVEAIYDHGRIEFTKPLQLRHERVRLIVDVPDEEIVNVQKSYNLPPEVEELAKAMEERLDRIRNAPLPDDADLPPLSPKQLDRIEAFALRDEIRSSR